MTNLTNCTSRVELKSEDDADLLPFPLAPFGGEGWGEGESS